LSFDPEKLASIGRLYNLETRIQTSKEVVDNVGDVIREGSSCETLLRQSSKESVDDVENAL